MKAAEDRMIREGTLRPGSSLVAQLAPPLTDRNRWVVMLWKRFDGHVDGATLALMCDEYGVDDLDALLGSFECIRAAVR